MAAEVRVPTTGNAGEDAVVLDIYIKVGDQVTTGQLLATLETAKAAVEIESTANGQVLAINAKAGDEVSEHSVLVVIGEAGETVSVPTDAAPSAAKASQNQSSAVESAAPSSIPNSVPNSVATDPAGHSRVDVERISPRARILAERNAINLAGANGTGPLGRILVNDVKAIMLVGNANALQIPTTAAPAKAVQLNDEFEIVPVRGARKVTAERMTASLQNTAQLTLTRYADATVLLGFLKRLREQNDEIGAPKVSVNDAVLFAASRAVLKHPAANSHFDFAGTKQFKHVHLGFAVDTGSALLVPVIRFADTLNLSSIASNAKQLIEKAKSGKLTGEEMSNGTFTVTNLGGLGVHWFTPVLNTPQSCILGIGATHQTHESAPKLMPLSLTFDHRAIDGAAAATLLADIAKAIEAFDVLAAN